MRYQPLFLASILLATSAYGKEPKAYQSGQVLRMDSVACRVDGKNAQTFTDAETAGDFSRQKTQMRLCEEYVLQSEQVVYRIRPRDQKHSVLLPISERAHFRFDKDKMFVQVEDLDNKEREYTVVSITPRGDSTANAAPVRLNHLQ